MVRRSNHSPPFRSPAVCRRCGRVPVQVWAVNESRCRPGRRRRGGLPCRRRRERPTATRCGTSTEAVGTAFGAVPAVAAAGRAGTISWSRRAVLDADAGGAAHGRSAPAPELGQSAQAIPVTGTADMAAADAGTAVDLVADDGNAGASNTGWVASALSPGAVSCAVVPAAAKLSAARLVVAAPAGPVLRPVSGAAATTLARWRRSVCGSGASIGRPASCSGESDDRVPAATPHGRLRVLALLASRPLNSWGRPRRSAGNHQIAAPTPRVWRRPMRPPGQRQVEVLGGQYRCLHILVRVPEVGCRSCRVSHLRVLRRGVEFRRSPCSPQHLRAAIYAALPKSVVPLGDSGLCGRSLAGAERRFCPDTAGKLMPCSGRHAGIVRDVIDRETLRADEDDCRGCCGRTVAAVRRALLELGRADGRRPRRQESMLRSLAARSWSNVCWPQPIPTR